MTRKDLDPALGRIERDTVLACGVFAAVAWLWSGAPAAAVGVLGGGLLMAVSYWTIKNAVDRLTAPAGEAPPGPMRVSVGVVLRVVGRYALLAGIAYVMIARLRLHPLSLLVGVSTLVVGIACEGLRSLVGRRAAS